MNVWIVGIFCAMICVGATVVAILALVQQSPGDQRAKDAMKDDDDRIDDYRQD